MSWLNHEAAPDILAEIVHVQREHVRQGDPQRMWNLLLDAVSRTSFSQYGFIGEVEWPDSGIPNLVTHSPDVQAVSRDRLRSGESSGSRSSRPIGWWRSSG